MHARAPQSVGGARYQLIKFHSQLIYEPIQNQLHCYFVAFGMRSSNRPVDKVMCRQSGLDDHCPAFAI